jgi:hypothetical protein
MTMHANAPDAFIRVIDLETTGQGLADGGVVEIGWQDVAPDRAGIWALRGPPDFAIHLRDPPHY